jgi:hypothetical protein
VDALRRNGVSLEPNTLSCELSSVPHASNMGHNGVSADPAVVEREGKVLCFLAKRGASGVRTTKYPGDQETGVSALNVFCAVYPSSADREATQVGRVKAALANLVASTRE